jgi:hypothetical protein
MDLEVGQTLGPYRITERLVAGGMAKVYRALQPSTGRDVAIKVLPAVQGSEAVSRFQREAQLLGSMQHPYILPLIDAGSEGDWYYLVMPLMRSGDLADRLLWQNGAMPFADVRRIGLQLADALDYAHSRGIVHRDLKPANVLMDERGNGLLSDFGIALPRGGERLTQVGYALGTPEYLAPEQAGGDTDVRSDLYSLGVIIYQMATGKLPFNVRGPTAWVKAHQEDAVPAPRTKNADVPEALERVIMKALQKDPAQRWSSAAELGAALREALPEPREVDHSTIPTLVTTQPRTIPPAAPPPAGVAPAASRRWVVPVILGVLVLGGAVAIFRPRSTPPPARAAVATPPAPVPTEAPVTAAAKASAITTEPAQAFDNFDDKRFDGAYDSTRWVPSRADQHVTNVQKEGALEIITTQRELGILASFANSRVRSVRARVRLEGPLLAGSATLGVSVSRASQPNAWVACYVYATRNALRATPACTDQRRRDFASGGAANLDAWHEVTLRFDTSGQATFDVDGQAVGTMPWTRDEAADTWYVMLSGWSEDGQEVRGAVDWVEVIR